MDNSTYIVSSSPYSREAALLTTAGVAGNPHLAGGVLLSYLAAGVASYACAFWSQRSRLGDFKQTIILSSSGQQASLTGVQNVHGSLLCLFVMDVFNAILTVIFGVQLARSTCSSALSSFIVFIAWFLTRYFAVVYHLLSALVCVLFLCHPQWGAKLRCITTAVVLLIFVLVPIYIFSIQMAAFGMTVIVLGLVIAIVAKCIMSLHSASPYAVTHKKLIVVVAVVTFLVVYAPSFVAQCLLFASSDSEEATDNYLIVYTNVLFFTSFHIAMDGLLFFFILRLSAEEQPQPQPQQQNLENPIYVSPSFAT